MKNSFIETFRTLSPASISKTEIQLVVDFLKKNAVDFPRSIREALQVLRITTFLECSQMHCLLLQDYLANRSIDAAEDHSVDVIVAADRCVPPTDAWLGYQFNDSNSWAAAEELAGPAEHVQDASFYAIARLLAEASSRIVLTMNESLEVIFLERLVRTGFERNLEQIPQNTQCRGFPRHFRPGQFLACKSLGIRTLLGRFASEESKTQD